MLANTVPNPPNSPQRMLFFAVIELPASYKQFIIQLRKMLPCPKSVVPGLLLCKEIVLFFTDMEGIELNRAFCFGLREILIVEELVGNNARRTGQWIRDYAICFCLRM